MDSSGGRAPPATAEAETAAAKRPSPQPARKGRKVATTESTAAVAPGPSTPGSSRARGRRCGKCGGCARCERYDGCMLTQLYCIALQKWKWPVMHIGSLCCFTFSPSLFYPVIIFISGSPILLVHLLYFYAKPNKWVQQYLELLYCSVHY